MKFITDQSILIFFSNVSGNSTLLFLGLIYVLKTLILIQNSPTIILQIL